MFSTGTPSVLRAMNERSVLELIRREGPVSRAEVARRTGLSKPTVSLALAGLAERTWCARWAATRAARDRARRCTS